MGELPHHHEDRKRLERLRSFIQEPESFQEVANLCRLLSDNSRVRIFWLLCHCEECVMNLSALVGMSSPAASHHLRQLKDSGLIVSRRVGKEVYYRAADTEVAQLLHQIIERTVEVTCPQSDSQLVSGAPHLPPLDQHDYCGSCPAEQLEVIRQVHRFLTEHLDSRITIEQLSRQFLMNPSTMKELFKERFIAACLAAARWASAGRLLLSSFTGLSLFTGLFALSRIRSCMEQYRFAMTSGFRFFGMIISTLLVRPHFQNTFIVS